MKPMNIVYKWKLDYLSNNKKCVNLKLLLQINKLDKPMCVTLKITPPDINL